MKILRSILIFGCLIALIQILPAFGQSRFELGFGWIFSSPALEDEFSTAFIPPFPGSTSTSASQEISLQGKFSYGMNGFLNIFITPNVGVQVLAEYHRPSLKGQNGPYDVTLEYTTTEPRTWTRDPNDWPATDGNFTEVTFSLNGIIRFPLPGSFWGALSGGVSSFYLEGEGIPLGFTKAWLDAENTLYVKTYQMVYEFGPETKYGFNIGGEISYLLLSRLAVSVDIRRFQCGSSEYSMSIRDEDVLDDPPEDIEAILGLDAIPLNINPSYTRISVALRVQF